ncbi:hypothetical protein HZS_2890 [Henneguya salminicola]|nr:hypothetical protein HZS_2890 [Henneguya salminicola]
MSISNKGMQEFSVKIFKSVEKNILTRYFYTLTSGIIFYESRISTFNLACYSYFLQTHKKN